MSETWPYLMAAFGPIAFVTLVIWPAHTWLMKVLNRRP